MAQAKSVADIYKSVVNDVIEGVREAFTDEGIDEQILQELKTIWEQKLTLSKAVEPAENEHILSRQSTAAAQIGIQIKQQQQQPQQMTTQLIAQAAVAAAAANTQQQPNSVQGQIFNIASAHQLNNSAQQTTTITLPVQAGTYQHHLTSLQYLVPNQSAQYFIQTAAGPQLIQQRITQPAPLVTMAAPATSAGTSQSLNAKTINHPIIQLDGVNDSSSEDDDDEDEEEEEQNEETEEPQGEEEDPLNSGDDISDTDPTEVFDAENVVVCQFDKINRSKNKWKFHLKDGIMNLNGKDYVFQKALGDAEW